MAIRVLFLGTPDFAVPTLQALLKAPDLEVVGVVTQPDRPAGRGQKLQAPPVKRLAQSTGLPVYQTPSLKKDPHALEWIRQHRPDLQVVVAFGQILTRDVFDLPPYGTLNVHASLLPKYRGAAPAAHAILQGETVTGVTIMKIDQGLDSGDTLSTVQVPIGENMTRGELEEALSRRGAVLLLETIPDYLSGRLRPRPQNHSQATLAPRICKEDGRIDWRSSALEIHNRIRACNPWPGGATTFRGNPLKLWGSRLAADMSGPADSRPGEILQASAQCLTVCCGGRTVLRLLEVQPPNRNRISATDFINGFHPRPGEVLGESS